MTEGVEHSHRCEVGSSLESFFKIARIVPIAIGHSSFAIKKEEKKGKK